jgi:hypothetical protein
MTKLVLLRSIGDKIYGLRGIYYSESKAKRVASRQKEIGFSTHIVKGTKDWLIATKRGEVKAGRRFWAVYIAGHPRGF